MSTLSALLHEYDRPLPRYTSYPPVPHWQSEPPTTSNWLRELARLIAEGTSLSIYIHLPFCESLCTYCACNKRITKNHRVETPYITAVLAEWRLYQQALGEIGVEQPPRLAELHLGGGTPTFFSAGKLDALMTGLLANFELEPAAELSLEAHPNATTAEQLAVLHGHGFRRLSVGVQDFSPRVQEMIHRRQSFELTEACIETARRLGYRSFNIDAIYGLPGQDEACVEDTFAKIRRLKPDRVAYYSYAHVPWKSPSQRGYSEADLPSAEAKMQLFLKGRARLLANGYQAIGMDHFVLPSDELFRKREQGLLNRNFMGYTTTQSPLLIGLGSSAISQSPGFFMQNDKTIEGYQQRVKAGQLAHVKGHQLSPREQRTGKLIKAIMCQGEAHWEPADEAQLTQLEEQLRQLETDGLVERSGRSLRATERGQLLLRPIAAAFDPKLAAQREAAQFSRSI